MTSSPTAASVLSTAAGKEALRSISPWERLLFSAAVEWQFGHARNIDKHLAKYGLVGTVRLRAAMVWWAVEIAVVWVAIITTVTGPRRVATGATIGIAVVFLYGTYRVATASLSGRAWRRTGRG